MINTNIGEPVSDKMIEEYFRTLVGRFFKILPMRENEDRFLKTYIRGLQIELCGCGSLIDDLGNDPRYLSLQSILQYLHDNPDSPVIEVRREVFGAISICNKIRSEML